jgi:hypothetical protein
MRGISDGSAKPCIFEQRSSQVHHSRVDAVYPACVKTQTFLRLSQFRGFWRLRAKMQRLRFLTLRQLFRARYFAKQERTNAGILFSVVKLAASQLIIAICVAAALQTLELLLVPYLISRWTIPVSPNYVSWLGTIAQIGGVFIALYFTAVTAAAGAIYAQVPNNIRDLLARERVGNAYIRYLTLATFLPLCLIAFHLWGFEPIRIGVPVVVIMAGIGIIAFTTLGVRAFYLFDPTKLADPLFVDLGDWLDQVSAGGFQWNDRSFQAHAHRQVVSIVDTLQTLSDLAATHANLESAPLLELCVRVVSLLAVYQRRKLQIPTDSLWFEQKYEHKSWYQTEDTAVQMAHRAGISLNPSSVSERDWLENRLQPIAIRCFELNLSRKRLDNVREILSQLDYYLVALSTNGDVKEAISLVLKLRDIDEQGCIARGTSDEGKKEQAEDVGMADVACLSPIKIMLAYRAALEHRTPDSTIRRLKKIRWQNPESLYLNDFVIEELREIEWMLPRIQMEIEVEGKVQTPRWYQQDIVMKFQAERLAECVNTIIESGNVFFQSWSERLVKSGRVWQSAAVLSRCLEYMNKLEGYVLPFFIKYYESLIASKHLTDLPWPGIEPEVWLEKVRDCSSELFKAVAEHIIPLSKAQKPEGVPDYRGQFVNETGENLFDSLLRRRIDEVLLLIGPYIAGTFVLFGELRPTTTEFDVWAEQKLQIAMAPVLDALELCGYAKLLSELYADDKLWEAVSSVWDRYLKQSLVTLPWLAAIITGGIPRFQIPHRGILRTNWSMRIQQELRKLPRHRPTYGGIVSHFRSDTVSHPSPLVRYCAKYEFHNGRDIFAALYLSKLPGAEGLDWGNGVQSLVESLSREEKSYDESDQDDDEKK